MATIAQTPQRMRALEVANEIRFARAAFKASLRGLTYEEARGRVADLLFDPPTFIHSMTLRKLLLAVPWLQENKVDWILDREHISPRKEVGDLSARQRDAVAGMLRTAAWVGSGEEVSSAEQRRQAFEERNQRVLELRGTGLTHPVIAERLDLSPKNVSLILCRFRRNGVETGVPERALRELGAGKERAA